MYLGEVEVKGQKDIVKVLQAIKYALKQPFSTDKEHENDVVCRISSDPGARTRTYLTCATNKEFTHRRYQAQMKLFQDESHFSQSSMSPAQDATLMLQNITGRNPDHVMRMVVDASKLGSLLQSIPDPAPAPVTSPASPAGVTSAAPATASTPAALW